MWSPDASGVADRLPAPSRQERDAVRLHPRHRLHWNRSRAARRLGKDQRTGKCFLRSG
jgi:hypothetical protein